MPLVLRNSTVTGNTAVGEDSSLLNFTKVMLRTDPLGNSDVDDYSVSQTSDRDASADTSGRQLDGFVVTFDRPVDPSTLEFDVQGRLLIGTDGGIWRGGGDDLLIGGLADDTIDASATEFESGLVYSGESGGMGAAAGSFFAYGDGFMGGVSVGSSAAAPNGRLYLGTEVGVFEEVNPTSWGLDRIDQRDLPSGQGSVFDTSYDLLV